MSSEASLITILVVIFSTGFLSGLTPCTIPTIAVMVAYVSGNQEDNKRNSFMISLAFIMGITFVLSILGMFAGIVGNVFIKTRIFNYIIATILIVMGFWMLKVIEFNVKDIKFSKGPKKGSGVLGAFILGLPFGISASPCTMPITASVLAYSATKGSPFIGFILMFTFAIGRSLPLLIAGTFTGLLKNLNGISKHQETIEKISGFILIVIAVYFICRT